MRSLLEELWGKCLEYEYQHRDQKNLVSENSSAEENIVGAERELLLKRLMSFVVGENSASSTVPETKTMETQAGKSGDDVPLTLESGADNLETKSSSSGASGSGKKSDETKDSSLTSISDGTSIEGSSDSSFPEASPNTTEDSCNVATREDPKDASPVPCSSRDQLAATMEPNSSVALGILNQLSEELCNLNRDGASLITNQQDAEQYKVVGAGNTTPTKIKFNFRTPKKSPAKTPNRKSSPSRSPLRLQTPKRPKQGTSPGLNSAKRKLLEARSFSAQKRYVGVCCTNKFWCCFLSPAKQCSRELRVWFLCLFFSQD